MASAVSSPTLLALNNLISSHKALSENISRSQMIKQCVDKREVLVAQCGALATLGPTGCTGRIPKDTYMVKDSVTEKTVDWTSTACNPMTPAVFDRIWNDAINVLSNKELLYVTDRVVGADPAFALPTRVVTSSALTSLFAENMFLPVPKDISSSVFAAHGFTMLVVPNYPVPVAEYEGVLRKNNGKTVDMLVAMDFERRQGIIFGTNYCGAVKKLMFTVLNYLLPQRGVLSLHCSANEDSSGKVALFLGLSGTGKTTLSNDPSLKLVGDDEHGWSDSGVANFEYGCYAKLIKLDPKKEKNIYEAMFSSRPVPENGAIIENAMVYPNGSFDLNDGRIAENSRGSFLLNTL